MTRKMTKDIKHMVNEANRLLKTQQFQTNEIERKTLQGFIEHILLQKGMYHGYNFYMVNEDGKLIYAGKETTLIQYYIV